MAQNRRDIQLTSYDNVHNIQKAAHNVSTKVT